MFKEDLRCVGGSVTLDGAEQTKSRFHNPSCGSYAYIVVFEKNYYIYNVRWIIDETRTHISGCGYPSHPPPSFIERKTLN